MAKFLVLCFVAIVVSYSNLMLHNLAELAKLFLLASVFTLLER